MLFYLPSSPKNQNFEKMKIRSGDIIILHICTIPYMTMIWCMVLEIWSVTDRIFVLLDWFFPFYPPNNLKKSKNQNHLEILSSYTSAPKNTIICYTIPEICHVTDVAAIFHFDYFLPFYSHNSPKTKISIKWKNRVEMPSFYTSVSNFMIIWYTAPETLRVTDVIIIFILGYFLPF